MRTKKMRGAAQAEPSITLKMDWRRAGCGTLLMNTLASGIQVSCEMNG